MVNSGVRRVVVPAFLACLAACTHWPADLERIIDARHRDYSRVPDVKYTYVNFNEVVANPTAYKLMAVQFEAIFNRHDEDIFLPGYIFQKPEDYNNFSVWAPTARLWMKEDRVRSLPTLYIRRDHPDLQAMLDTPRYSLVQIRGWISNDYENLPYIELIQFDVLDYSVYSEAALGDLAAAEAAARANEPAVAIERLEAALKGTLGAGAQVVAHSRLAQFFWDRGDYQNAMQHYGAVLKLDPENPDAQTGWENCERELERLRAIEEGAGAAPEPEPQPEP